MKARSENTGSGGAISKIFHPVNSNKRRYFSAFGNDYVPDRGPIRFHGPLTSETISWKIHNNSNKSKSGIHMCCSCKSWFTQLLGKWNAKFVWSWRPHPGSGPLIRRPIFKMATRSGNEAMADFGGRFIRSKSDTISAVGCWRACRDKFINVRVTGLRIPQRRRFFIIWIFPRIDEFFI